MIEVWVEIFNDDSSNAIKSTSNSHFRLGKTSLDAYLAADLMRKAKESRKEVETAVSASNKFSKTAKAKVGAFFILSPFFWNESQRYFIIRAALSKSDFGRFIHSLGRRRKRLPKFGTGARWGFGETAGDQDEEGEYIGK
jgi:hypothetical protein